MEDQLSRLTLTDQSPPLTPRRSRRLQKKLDQSSSDSQNGEENEPTTPPPFSLAKRLIQTTPRRRRASALGRPSSSPFRDDQANDRRRGSDITLGPGSSCNRDRSKTSGDGGGGGGAAVLQPHTPVRRRLLASSSSDSARSSPAQKLRPLRLAYFEAPWRTVDCIESDSGSTVSLAISYSSQWFRFEFDFGDSGGGDRPKERCIVPFTTVQNLERTRGGFRLVIKQQHTEGCVLQFQKFDFSTSSFQDTENFLFPTFEPAVPLPKKHCIDFDFHTRSMVEQHWNLLKEDTILGPTVARSITTDYAIRELIGHGDEMVLSDMGVEKGNSGKSPSKTKTKCEKCGAERENGLVEVKSKGTTSHLCGQCVADSKDADGGGEAEKDE